MIALLQNGEKKAVFHEMTEMPKPKTKRRVLGWREKVELPDLDCARIEAKIDSGAKSSVLGAEAIKKISLKGRPYVEFCIQRRGNAKATTSVRAPFVGKRRIRSSNGVEEDRFVIETRISLDGKSWKTELTLTDRSAMDFQLLLGRQTLGRKFLVNPSASWLARP